MTGPVHGKISAEDFIHHSVTCTISGTKLFLVLNDTEL